MKSTHEDISFKECEREVIQNFLVFHRAGSKIKVKHKENTCLAVAPTRLKTCTVKLTLAEIAAITGVTLII